MLRLSLTLEETNLGTQVATMGLKKTFPLKAVTSTYCIELVLCTAILAMVAWFVACIW